MPKEEEKKLEGVEVRVVREFSIGPNVFQPGEIIRIPDPNAFYEFTCGHRVVPTEKIKLRGCIFLPPDIEPDKKEEKQPHYKTVEPKEKVKEGETPKPKGRPKKNASISD